MKHIILVGFMGCGKTCTGKALAKRLNLPFIDMDEQIVKKANMPITDIFVKYGEQYFRKLESEVLKDLLATKEQTVISAGGGVPMQATNQSLLERGIVVYIKAPMEVLMLRLANDKKRPILQGGNLHEKITTMMSERGPIYEQVSDIEVLTRESAIDKVVGQIVEKLVEKTL